MYEDKPSASEAHAAAYAAAVAHRKAAQQAYHSALYRASLAYEAAEQAAFDEAVRLGFTYAATYFLNVPCKELCEARIAAERTLADAHQAFLAARSAADTAFDDAMHDMSPICD